MATKPLPSQEVLRQLLRYEPETGKLFWLPRRAHQFAANGRHTAEHAAKKWNARYAGKEAGTSINGYVQIAVYGLIVRAHRVIWKMMTGYDPDEIDHINGIRSDNRWHNIRDVDRAENAKNIAVKINSRIGVSGVTWSRQRRKWCVHGRLGGRTLNLGRFDCFEDAVRRRRQWLLENGFHPNHGRPATSIGV